ncbi:MAG: acyltransferase domain-containing protein [Lachnospiraceae bacterium]
MTKEEFYQAIGLSQGAQMALGEVRLNKTKERYWEQKFYNDRVAFYEWLRNMPNGSLTALAVYIELALNTYQSYQEQGIEQQVYIDTFRDLAIWCEHNYKMSGSFGILEWEWLSYSVDMRVFRLGRLQFEPTVLDREVVWNEAVIPVGTKVLNVHIPEGEPLLKSACDRSFEKAKEFFQKEYPYAVCTTWLLSPELGELLDATSNIYQFQQRFYIYDVDHSFPQIEQRVFGKISRDKARYPEQNELQRKVKQKLLAGTDFGMGCGILVCS